jgi:hypothetical protein
MATRTIYTSASRADLKRRLSALPGILSGRLPDRLGIARGYKLRLAVAFLEKIKLAFITKSRGGTDECGISWPRLSRAYLAYGRRFGRGEQAALKRAAGLGRGNRFAPGGHDGLLTRQQEREWWTIYRRNLAWLAATMPIGRAKGRAAAIAWAEMKRRGARTKLDVYGNREVEILRDTGTLFNSLQPGILSEMGPDASYSAPDGQIVIDRPGELLVGTNVEHGRHHQGTPERPGRRRFLPRPDEIPQDWHDDFAAQADAGLPAAIEMIARGAA